MIVKALFLAIGLFGRVALASDLYLQATTGRSNHPNNPPKPIYCGDNQCSIQISFIQDIDKPVMEITPINMGEKLTQTVTAVCERIEDYKNFHYKCLPDSPMVMLDPSTFGESVRKIEPMIEYFPQRGQIHWAQNYFFKSGSGLYVIADFFLSK